MLKTKNIKVITVIGLSAILIVCISFFAVNKCNNIKLRDKYFMIKASNYSFDAVNLDFEDRISVAPHIAKIRVVKRLPEYTVLVEDEEVGVSTEVVFCQFEVKLIAGIAGNNIATEEDGTFIICFAEGFENSYPELTDGLEAICSLQPAAGVHSGKYLLYDKSFYYVEDNMALASYEGDDSPAKIICTETKLVNEIKKIRSS